jgi:hypothetical protein
MTDLGESEAARSHEELTNLCLAHVSRSSALPTNGMNCIQHSP